MLLKKASVGMYSGCDYLLSLKILFVYFLALPSLLHPSILFNCFILVLFQVDHTLSRKKIVQKPPHSQAGYIVEPYNASRQPIHQF